MYAKIIMLLMLLALTGCSSNDLLKRFSLPIQLKLETNAELNQTNSFANPVAIRFYQLEKSDRFMQSDFMTLFNDDKAVLAEQLIERQRWYPVMPQTSEFKTIELLPGVRHVAELVEFTEYKAGSAKTILTLPEDLSSATVLWLGIQGTSVNFSVVPEESWWDSLFSWGAS